MGNVIPTVLFVLITLIHKWFVFVAGLRTGAPLWLLFIHDWSKFTPAEAPHYGRQLFGTKDDPIGFSKACLHHQNLNPHHWEYWIPRIEDDRGGFRDGDPLPMPEKYVREMVADWMGAGRVYEGEWPKSCNNWPWFEHNFPMLKLHPETAEMVLAVVGAALPLK